MASSSLSGWMVRAVLAAAMVIVAHSASAQTIRMWTFLDPGGKTGREVVLKKLIERFEAANPGVKIQVEPQVWQQMSSKFMAAHQTGSAPDVAWVHSPRVIEAIKLGALANLDELFVKTWSKEDIDDIDGTFWRHGATPNAHYHIVHSRSSVGQFYRADLFKEAGIDPKSLTTWDKFIAAAQKLMVRDANGNVTRWGFGQTFTIEGANSSVLFNVLLDKQKQIFDDKGRATWATPAGVEGLTLQTDMVRKHKITPDGAVNTKSDDLYDQFNAGRIAIIRGASARLPNAMTALGAEKVGYLSTPSFTEGKYSPTEAVGFSVGVWSGSKSKELAGKWVEFISSREADALWTMEGRVVPIRKSTIKNNEAFFTNPNNAYLAAVSAEMIEYGWFAPENAAAGWNEEFNRAAQDVLVNNADPKAALQKVEAAYNRANRK